MNSSLLRKYVTSPYMDVLGVVIVLGVSYAKGFHETIYKAGEVSFNAGTDYLSMINNGIIPLGLLSMVAACISMMSGRLAGRQNNLGNGLNMLIAITSGTLDFIFGNRSAILTYPITFIVASFTTYKWSTGIKIKKADKFYYLIIIISMLLAFGMVHLGFYLFGGKEGFILRNSIALIFGFSLAGNATAAFKYKDLWANWMLYNILQLIKNILLFNFANVVKYIFYMFNAVITYLDWRINGDMISK